MKKQSAQHLNFINNRFFKSKTDSTGFRKITLSISENIVPITVGSILGLTLLVAILFPSQWTGLIFLAIVVLTIVLLVNDLKKLLLIVFVIDIPLGFDIALANRPGHQGGPAGFLISLMTIALGVGYARWLITKPTGTKMRIRDDIAIPAIIFLFITLVSVFQATEVWFTFTQFFLTLQFVLMYFYLINHVHTWTDVRLIVSTLAISVLLESMLMLLQYYGNLQFSIISININRVTTRATGTFPGPNLAASFLAPAITIILAAYLTDNRLINKRLALLAMIVGLIALILTRSRTGWLGLVVASLIVIWQALRNRIRTKTILSLFGVALLIGVGFSSLILNRIARDDNNSALSRLWTSQLALNVIQEHMLTGIGANNQQFVYDNTDYVPVELMGKERDEIHNAYLATWVELGVFGLLTFVWMLMATGWHAFSILFTTTNRYASITAAGFLGALIYFILHMAVGTFTGRRPEFLWLVLALITVTSMLANQTSDIEQLGEN